MPNEKKSATLAIRSATKQARGSSIIVPTWIRSSVPPSSSTTRSTSPRISWSSFSYATSGIMISTSGGSGTASAARTIARICIS